ncbi:MAG: PBP1A family penicillin-binding protein [Thermodesulfobacteriota bacterium]
MNWLRRDRAPRGSVGALFAWLIAGLPCIAVCAAVAGLAGGLIGGYLSFSQGLPKIPDLRAYRPKTVSVFYAEDGTVIGIFYREKRFPIDLRSMPPHVINAFIAGEDARFFSHTGVDWIGVVRALVKNLQSGNFSQGGSTITQQVTRNFLLTKEKKVSRKIREAILAFRLEKTLTKEEILGLYLNEIYLGKGAYGVEAAARNYFGKTTKELSVGEAALLAGLVPNPNKFAPHRNLQAALERRNLVLQSMLRNGFISEETYRKSLAEVLQFRENLPNTYQRAPYFAEAVRQYLIGKYGEDRLYNEGLHVWTTCDLGLQNTAQMAVLEGAQAWEKRHGRPSGLVKRLTKAEAREFLAATPQRQYEVGDVVEAMVVRNETRDPRSRKKSSANPQECVFALPGGAEFGMQLTAEYAYRPNDVLEFTVTEADRESLKLQPIQMPPVESALVCIENNTGYVRALVGGLDFDRSRFNRATQARRQPGSAFKPLLYAAALEWGLYGPRTMVVDEPVAISVDPREPEWIPTNSDGNFYGPINLRQALAHSRNIAAVKLILDIGVDATIEMARSMGIESPLGKNLSLCLGASEVTLLELTSAYSVFPNMGVRLEPVLVKKVVDRFGNVLEDNTVEPIDVTKVVASYTAPPPALRPSAPAPVPGHHSPSAAPFTGGRVPAGAVQAQVPMGSQPNGAVLPDRVPAGEFEGLPRVMSPKTAYLMTSMLRDTCVYGTAAAVGRLRRDDLSGKTGTTDDCSDAWFVGFNSRYTTGVWVGHDTRVSLGRKEYGNVAALPIWMSFMKVALSGTPSRPCPVPEGIVFWKEASDQQGRQRGAPEADLAPAPELKPVCPVDVVAPAPYYHVDPQTGQVIPVSAPASALYEGFTDWGHTGASYPGMVRVLSARGEFLGHAYLSVDQKGKTVLYRDQMAPAPDASGQGYTMQVPANPLYSTPQADPEEGVYQDSRPAEPPVDRGSWWHRLPFMPRYQDGGLR